MTDNTRDEKLRREYTSWHTAETTFAYGVTNNMNIADWWLERLHHQLQKARQDWLREEIVKLEGMKKNCCAGIGPCDEICRATNEGNHIIQTIIDRYKKKLDQPNK